MMNLKHKIAHLQYNKLKTKLPNLQNNKIVKLLLNHLSGCHKLQRL